MARSNNPLPVGSPAHTALLEHVRARLRFSEEAMRKFHPRWTANERRAQAYINLRDYERLLKEQNEASGPPQVVNIVVPHMYATLATAVTYWLHTFAGRVPMFAIRSHNGTKVASAQNMEIVLQYYADHTRFIKWLYGFLNDAALYGVGVMRVGFETKRGLRTVMKNPGDGLGFWSRFLPQQPYRARESRIIYQGSTIESVDPFMFFPDPRVPMADVNRKGEYVFWRSFIGHHALKAGEYDGLYFDVDEVPRTLPSRLSTASVDSSRSAISGGDPHPGAEIGRLRSPGWDKSLIPYYQIDEGTIELIPSQLGLERAFKEIAEPDRPQKWLVTLANDAQIVRAAPFDHDHNLHPVAVTEPHSMGYGFGQPAMADFIAPLQDLMSWLFNSHMESVRNAIANQFIVDPSMIEMQDLKRRVTGGKIIRLKRAAYGQDVRAALTQLPVSDVTRGHMADLPTVARLADAVTGISDNLRAVQDAGSRKTATEVRVSADSGASRLASTAKIISAQGITDVTEIMSLDTQQFLTEEFSVQMLGNRALQSPITVQPGELIGDYYYPVSDGTLPHDKVALFDLWNQLYGQIMADPLLATTYDRTRVFEWIAELGGARNIEQFRVTVQPDPVVAGEAAAGNLMPMGEAAPALGGSGGGLGNFAPTDLAAAAAEGGGFR